MGRRPEIDGRALLLASALELFATEGVDAVSIRAVNRHAGLGPASVHYHFGTKDALLDALLRERGASVREEIRSRAKQLTEASTPPSSRDLVLMLAQPYVELAKGRDESGREWIRLVSQLLQSDPARVLDRQSARLTAGAVSRVYPDAASADIQRALRMCFALLISQLAQTGVPTKGRRYVSFDLDLLVDFLSGGLDATLTSTTRRSRGTG